MILSLLFMYSKDHEFWMRKAISLAKTAWGKTHPNPMVGSLLVYKDDIIASGYHAKAGELHAERSALTNIELTHDQQENAVLYVTLEPCCTHGKTPPCTDIIIEKKIKHVVVGTLDPNPSHQGRGLDVLEDAGVNVEHGILSKECDDLNLIFNHIIRTSTPMIALKSAVTLDGKIATEKGYSKWITGGVARENVMLWREYFPAIGVGAGTAIADNPSLTIRKQNRVISCPIRFIFDRSLQTKKHIDSLNVYNDQWSHKTIVVTSTDHSEADLKPFKSKGCVICDLNYQTTDFPLMAFKEWCWQNRIYGVYLEGGPTVSSSFINQRGIDYLFTYQAPKLFISNNAPGMVTGGDIQTPSDAPFIEAPIHEVFGSDLLTRGHLSYTFG